MPAVKSLNCPTYIIDLCKKISTPTGSIYSSTADKLVLFQDEKIEVSFAIMLEGLPIAYDKIAITDFEMTVTSAQSTSNPISISASTAVLFDGCYCVALIDSNTLQSIINSGLASLENLDVDFTVTYTDVISNIALSRVIRKEKFLTVKRRLA
jgi:hypothetical protein